MNKKVPEITESAEDLKSLCEPPRKNIKSSGSPPCIFYEVDKRKTESKSPN